MLRRAFSLLADRPDTHGPTSDARLLSNRHIYYRVLADTRLALIVLIVLVLSAAVLVLVLERFACMASTRLALRPIDRCFPNRGSCPYPHQPIHYQIPARAAR